MSTPSVTPNVIVGNPAVRKVVNIILGVSALVLPIAGILDQYVAGDWSPVLLPAGAITLFIAGAFGLTVTVPNIPSANAQIAVAVVDEPVEVVGEAADHAEPGYNPHV
jgi:hypothetical protein